MTPFEMLEEFEIAFYGKESIGQPITRKLRNLRHSLISEEWDEVDEELFPGYDLGEEDDIIDVDKAKLTKELADLLYVVIGTATVFDLPLEKVFEAVHKNNMSKVNAGGIVMYREDGKVLKPDNYKPLDLTQFFTGE